MLAIIAVAELLGMCVWFAANAVSPQLALQWNLTPSEAGWLSTAVQLGFVMGTGLAALFNIADVLPSRAYFALAAVAASLTNAGLLLVGGFGGALVCRALTGVFLAGVYPPAMKMAATWFQNRRGLAIGTVVGALTIGKATPYLIHAFPGAGIRPVLLWSSAAAFVAAALIAIAYRDGPAPFPRRVFSLRLVGQVMRHDAYRSVLGGYAGHMLELYACWIWLPSFISASVIAHGDAGAAGAWASAMSFVVIAAGAIGCVVGGELADRVGPVRLVVSAMALSGACALLTPLVFGGNNTILVLLLLVWSIAVIADSAQFSTLVTRVVAPDSVGTALTLQTSIGFLVTTITIQLVPVLATWLGWRYAFPVLALGPAMGIGVIRRLRV